MNKFNAFIEKRNFKKIFIVYIIAAVVCAVACAAAVGAVYKDKISLALRYEKASESFKKQSGEETKQSISGLAASSNDILDILLLNGENSIVYSAKNTNLAWDKTFDLEKADGSRFLTSGKNPNAVFRFVKKDEFMLSAVFADDFGEIHDEYDEESFYLSSFQSKKLYMISLLGKSANGTKAYVISDPKPVRFGIVSLKAAASVIMLLFMIYWIIIALWVFQDARKSKLNAPVWGIVALFTNLAGALVYLIYKNINCVCSFCGAVLPRGSVFCSACGKKIGTLCPKCGHSLKQTDKYCPKCGQKRD